MSDVRSQFIKGFKQLGGETAEKLVENTVKIVEPIITAQELLGDIRPMSEEELANKKAEEEQKRRSQISDVRSQLSGRDVQNEMEQIRHQKESEEEEKERYFQKMKEQQKRENQQQMESSDLMMESSNPAKQKKSRGSAFNHKKKQQPDQSQMSQTTEFKGKID